VGSGKNGVRVANRNPVKGVQKKKEKPNKEDERGGTKEGGKTKLQKGRISKGKLSGRTEEGCEDLGRVGTNEAVGIKAG